MGTKNWLQWATMGLVVASLLVDVSQCLYPYDNDASYMMFGVSKELASGQDPWDERHVQEPPYVSPMYGPALHALGGVGWALFGRQFWFLRVLRAGGFVASLVALHRIGRRGGGGKRGAWLSILIFVGFGDVLSDAGGGRGDVAGLGCATLGIALLLDAPVTGTRAFVVAGLLCGMAPLIKQFYVVPIAVGTLFCLLRRSRAQAVAFFSAAAGLPLSVFVALDALSHGGLWRMTVVYPSLTPRSIGHLMSLLVHQTRDPVWDMSIFMLAWAILEIARRPHASLLLADDTMLVLAMWLPPVLVQDLLMATRHRAHGYWLELWFVVAATLPPLLAATEPTSRWLLRVRDAFPALLILAGIVAYARRFHGAYFDWKAIPYYESLVDLVRERSPATNPVLTEYSDIPERAGREAWFNSPELYGLSTKRNQDLLKSELDAGRFAVLLLRPQGTDLYSLDRYARVATRLPFPTKVWAVAPYIRKDLLTPDDVVISSGRVATETRP
jgi:hypothetical protein